MRTLRLDILAAAAAITLLLIYTMQALIQTSLPTIDVNPPKIPPITVKIEEIVPQYPSVEMPIKPKPVDPPPPIPTTTQVKIDRTVPTVEIPRIPETNVKPVIGRQAGALLPVVKPAPQYPSVALSRGIEAFVTVEFTVTASGATRNVVVVDAVTVDGKPTSLFDRAAIAAAEKFRYQPQMQDGKGVEVHGVRNRFVFEMQK